MDDELVRQVGSSAHAEAWERFRAHAQRWKEGRPGRFGVATVANMFAIAVRGDLDDYLMLDRLAALRGLHHLAQNQHLLSKEIEVDEKLRLGSRYVQALAPPFYGSVLSDGLDPDRAATVARTCTRAAMRFMLAGAHEVAPGPDIESPERFLHHFLHEHVTEWRAQLVRYAEDPWSPYARRLVALANAANHPEFGKTVDDFVGAMREDIDERDRRAVSQEIRRLVAESGLTQRELAERVGTSASRLSTYCAGQVTPSAALLLRIRRVSHRCGARTPPPGPRAAEPPTGSPPRSV